MTIPRKLALRGKCIVGNMCPPCLHRIAKDRLILDVNQGFRKEAQDRQENVSFGSHSQNVSQTLITRTQRMCSMNVAD